MSKPVTKSKTFWVNACVLLVAGVVGMQNCEVVVNYPELVTYFVGIVGAVNVVLRFLTNSPVTLVE
ncbi:unnamed protein product [marine sediment metagenome]|uniref:Holin n=1 Tax=marine sediment metagenome TaxID=412755 RepID=X0SEX0_9ZZZZ